MSGIETLRRLRASRSVSELPVVMLTAKDASADVIEALDLGANDYVTKPIDYAVTLACDPGVSFQRGPEIRTHKVSVVDRNRPESLATGEHAIPHRFADSETA